MGNTSKVEFFVGGNVDGKPTHSHEDLEKACAVHLPANGIESFTIYPTIGYWKGQRELSVQVIAWVDTAMASYKKAVEALYVALQQEEILVAVDGVTVA